MDRKYWTVPRMWAGQTAYILGGGPSLEDVDTALLCGRRVIAINNAWERWRTADILYFCDASWWLHHKPLTDKYDKIYSSNHDAVLRNFTGLVVSIADSVNETMVHSLRYDQALVLSDKPDLLAHGGNSGYQAVNLAVLLGVTRIVLLGFDMRVYGSRTHWHQGHKRPDQTTAEYADMTAHRISENYIRAFGELVEPLEKLGVGVVHGTPTAMPYWPVRPIRDVV